MVNGVKFNYRLNSEYFGSRTVTVNDLKITTTGENSFESTAIFKDGKCTYNNDKNAFIADIREQTIMEHICTLDGKKDDLSLSDLLALRKQKGIKTLSDPAGRITNHKFEVIPNSDFEQNGVVELIVRDDRSDEVSRMTFDIETEYEKKMKAQNEAKYQESQKNRIAAFKLVKEAGGFEKPVWDKRYIDGKRQDCLLVNVVKRQTIKEIEEKFGLKEGTLIKYNPSLKDLEPGLLDRLLGNDAKVSDISLLIPAFELNQREN